MKTRIKNQTKILLVIGIISITACLIRAYPNQITNMSDNNALSLVKNSAIDNVVRTLNEMKVNDYITNDQDNPSVCALSSDTFVVVWESSFQDTNGAGVYAKVINATTGTNMTAEFRVNDYITNDQDNPSVCALSSDTFVVVWESSFQDTNGVGVYATVINATTGTNMTAEFRVNDYITNDQDNPSVCALSSDSFAVAWESSLQDTNGEGVYATVINATTGTNITAEFRVNDYIINNQFSPSVSTLSSDLFTVVWESRFQDTNGAGVYATVINATTGNVVTAEFQVNNYIISDQANPSVCTLSNISFAIAWESNLQDTNGAGVYTSFFFVDNAPVINSPTPVDGATGINNNPSLVVNVSDADGEDLTVYFYDNTTGFSILIGNDNISGGGPAFAAIVWNGRVNRTEYKWYVMVSDGIVNTTSIMWSFMTHYIVYGEGEGEIYVPGYDLFFLLCIALAATVYLIRKKQTPNI